MEALTRAVRRYGAALGVSRQAIARLDRDEGRYDGLLLGALYVFGVGSYRLVDATAGLFATRDLGGLLMLASALGGLVLAPILVLVAAETLLGRARSHRSALALVPLVAAGVVAHELPWVGISAPALVPEVVGGLAGLLLVWRLRPAIEPDQDEVAAP